MTKKKPTTLQLDNERYQNWTDGTGPRADRTPLEATLARLAYFEGDLESMGALLRLAWHPNGPELLLALIEHARRQPGRDGLTSAVDSTIAIVDDIWRVPMKEGGRKRSTADREGTIWVMFQGALGRARQQRGDPKYPRDRVIEQFAEDSRKGRGYWHNDHRATTAGKPPAGAFTFNKPSNLDKRLKLFEARVPKAERDRLLQKFLPDLCHLLGAPLYYDAHVDRWLVPHHDDHVIRWIAHSRLLGEETPTP